MKALVIGGTGPTGPHIVNGLLDRGYDVSLFHRGTHESNEVANTRHIHGDPHFAESIEESLGSESFDLVIATYGRIKHQAGVLGGRCERFFGVGGAPVYAGCAEPWRRNPFGMKILVREDDEVAGEYAEPVTRASKFAAKMVATERAVMDLHAQSAFKATWFRYPKIYGPRNPIPWEWSVIKRASDGRRFIILADGGHNIRSRSAGRNAAHAVLLAVDHPLASAGEVFNVAEDHVLSIRQWVEELVTVLESDLRVQSLPYAIGHPGYMFLPFQGTGSPHVVLDTSKIRTQLGYQDVVSVRDALAESIDWYRLNPVTSTSHPMFADKFLYAKEDALVAAYNGYMTRLQSEVPWGELEATHTYAHPKEPGETRDHLGR